jgi:hypothetical protein
MFSLARELKGIPGFNDIPAEQLTPVFEDWLTQSLPFIATKDHDTNWAEFRGMWWTVLYGAGHSGLADTLALADAAPLPLSALRYQTPWKRRLVALCQALQQHAGEEPIFLACREAGKLFGLSHTSIANALRDFVQDGVLTLVRKGHRGWAGHRGRASTYRYVRSEPQKSI